MQETPHEHEKHADQNKSKAGIVVSLVIAVVLVGGAIVWAISSNKPDTTKSGENQVITKAELTAANGKDGKKCYVAVDGTVYEIEDSPLWQNGEHTTSKGQAHCGLDLSEVIKQSPHGKSKLTQLPKVGRLE